MGGNQVSEREVVIVNQVTRLFGENLTSNPTEEQLEGRASQAGGDNKRRVRAYLLWEKDGRPEGRDLNFWERAAAVDSEQNDLLKRAPVEFAGETGADPLPRPTGQPKRRGRKPASGT
jgi:hypothetical protein